MIKLLMLPQQVAEDEWAQAYRLSGQSLLTNAVLQELAAFKSQPPGSVTGRSSSARHAAGLHTGLVYQGPGWIANQWRLVECYSSPAGYRVVVCGAGAFFVTKDGCNIHQTEAEPGGEQDVLIETMLGPVLILALALQGTYCLHASAVTLHNHLMAFPSQTGHGKSTLASFLGSDEGGGWRRVADDILPVALHSGGLDALPHFPQLKLAADRQPAVGLPERMPLGTFYFLDPAASTQTQAEIEPLGWQEAVLALVQHTVAARLFDRDLLTRHLSFCAEAAARVPVRRLAIPRDLTVLPQVRDLLTADLGSA